MDDDLLSTAEVLDIFNISCSTLDRWIDDGILPVIQPYPRGERRFRRADIDQLLRPRAS